MATMKILSMRLKSVKSIQKITKSMRMVSAAKYSRAEKDLRVARPHGNGIQTFYDKLEFVDSNVQPKERKVIVAITSDKGLCGAVHTQIVKEVKKDIGKNSGDTRIICVGDRSRSQLQNTIYRNNIALVVQEMGRLPPKFLDASIIALQILKINFDVGKIIYNKFKTVVAYNVSHINLFSRESVLDSHKAHLYESLDSEIDDYLEFSLASLIYYALKESACSEQASRMTAMENASKNAGDMINMLTLKVNRTRQAVITRELIEIISGAAALK